MEEGAGVVIKDKGDVDEILGLLSVTECASRTGGIEGSNVDKGIENVGAGTGSG